MKGRKKNIKNNQSEECFLLKELKERIDIQQKSKLFENSVDFAKTVMIDQLYEEHSQREKWMKEALGKIEKALKSEEPENIKSVLREISS
ncbi:MAG: hypothetical protein PUC12_06095 [Clostridiales bacterium]|nr:hypothetical protein [Clostridiales bacterium]